MSLRDNSISSQVWRVVQERNLYFAGSFDPDLSCSQAHSLSRVSEEGSEHQTVVGTTICVSSFHFHARTQDPRSDFISAPFALVICAPVRGQKE